MSKVKKPFEFKQSALSGYLVRTTDNIESLKKEIFKWDNDFDIAPLKGIDFDLEQPLTELQNPQLVFSLMLHCLGRGLLCSNNIFIKFKRQLKVNLQKSCEKIIPKDTEYIRKICRLETAFGIEELITPYNELYLDLETYKNETIGWDEYVNELELRQTVMDNLRDSCNTHNMEDTQQFLPDLYSNLHFDSFCWKSLRNSIMKETFLKNERTIIWRFPGNINLTSQQIREPNQSRTDFVVHQKMTKDVPFKYKHFMKEPGVVERLKNILIDPNNEKLKNSGSKQVLCETVLTVFGFEVIKNPAALIYNMMMIDLIQGKQSKIFEHFDFIAIKKIFEFYLNLKSKAKKASQAEFFESKEKEGILPYDFENYTTASRILNTYYSHIFGHWHSYDITDENENKILNSLGSVGVSNTGVKQQFVQRLLKREHNLVNKWINLKAETSDKAIRTIMDLWEVLTTNTKLWYEPLGLSLE